MEGIPIEKQEIRKGKKKLEDFQTIRDCWITDNMTVSSLNYVRAF